MGGDDNKSTIVTSFMGTETKTRWWVNNFHGEDGDQDEMGELCLQHNQQC
jgi:hypothetical protein